MKPLTRLNMKLALLPSVCQKYVCCVCDLRVLCVKVGCVNRQPPLTRFANFWNATRCDRKKISPVCATCC